MDLISKGKKKVIDFVNSIFTEISKFIIYIKYDINEIKKRKLSYLLGVMSCLIVVSMVGLSFSALEKVPLIFLRIAEKRSGKLLI
jgi:hypothetical protein